MNSRMEKYNFNKTTTSRNERNQKLYNQIDDIDIDYIDLNDETEIDLFNTNKSRIGTRENYHKARNIESIFGKEENKDTREEIVKEESKSYDIKELLQKAREENTIEKDEKRRYINTEYNILTKLDLEHIEEEKEELKKENLKSLIDTIYSNTLPVDLKKEINKPIMSDLLATVEINEDISKKILDDDSTTKVVERKKKEEEEEEEEEDKDTNELRDLINQTFIQPIKKDKGKAEKKEETTEVKTIKSEVEETIRQESSATEEFNILEEKKDKKFTIVVAILAVLAVLAVGAVVLAKYLDIF